MKEEAFSIGTIAKVTGFSVDQLRIWERRYGKPKALRLKSGHRRYSRLEIRRLMLVKQALDNGSRPNQVVDKTEKELMELLGQRKRERIASVAELPKPLGEWVEAARGMKDETLLGEFDKEWKSLGSPRFFIERAVPFMKALGEGWQQGELCVAEEHLASEALGDYLSMLWRSYNRGNDKSPVVVTTLPGDYHRNAILMISLIAAAAGRKVIYLGPSTPLEEVAIAASRSEAGAVCVSAALLPLEEARAMISSLRKKLPEQVQLVVGGLGDVQLEDGISHFESLEDFDQWIRKISPVAGKALAGLGNGL